MFANKSVANGVTAGVLLAFVGGVYVYTMKAVGKDNVDEVISKYLNVR